MADKHIWTYEEDVVVGALYALLKPENIRLRNPRVINVAAKFGIDPGSVHMRLQNFQGLDPKCDTGPSNAAKSTRLVFAELQKDRQKIIDRAAEIVGPVLYEES